jgi:hypothetical protein
MTEPATSSLAIAAAATTATAASALVPGVDANALIGAIAGGALFVTSSRDLSFAMRLVYLLISAGAGYVAAPEIVSRLPITSTGVAAFLAGALAITVATQIIERAKAFDFTTLIKRGT